MPLTTTTTQSMEENLHPMHSYYPTYSSFPSMNNNNNNHNISTLPTFSTMIYNNHCNSLFPFSSEYIIGNGKSRRRRRDEMNEEILSNKRQCIETNLSRLSLSTSPKKEQEQLQRNHNSNNKRNDWNIMTMEDENDEIIEIIETKPETKEKINETITINLEEILPVLKLEELCEQNRLYLNEKVKTILQERLQKACSNQIEPSAMDKLLQEFIKRIQCSNYPTGNSHITNNQKIPTEIIKYSTFTLLSSTFPQVITDMNENADNNQEERFEMIVEEENNAMMEIE